MHHQKAPRPNSCAGLRAHTEERTRPRTMKGIDSWLPSKQENQLWVLATQVRASPSFCVQQSSSTAIASSGFFDTELSYSAHPVLNWAVAVRDRLKMVGVNQPWHFLFALSPFPLSYLFNTNNVARSLTWSKSRLLSCLVLLHRLCNPARIALQQVTFLRGCRNCGRDLELIAGRSLKETPCWGTIKKLGCRDKRVRATEYKPLEVGGEFILYPAGIHLENCAPFIGWGDTIAFINASKE